MPAAPTPPHPLRARPWKRLTRRLLRSPAATGLAARTAYQALRFIHGQQRPAAGSSDHDAILRELQPAIVGMWHGQHLLAPFFRPIDLPFVALLSRNRDAEVNAWVVERFGIGTVRGSGGRADGQQADKGGARALIALRRALADGRGVFMIADISKAAPREAGLGIVTLARISGRPIVPAAATTSRRRVLERTWDKTQVPLPFGRMAVVLGAPIFVPADADAATMEHKRREVTAAIEAANRRADALAAGTDAAR